MVKKPSYIPRKGDMVWMDFTPQAGREQAGRRPALVVSSTVYNAKGLMLACPITSKVKGYPFEVTVKGKKVNGCVLADHIKNQDWKARNVVFIETSPAHVFQKVSSLIAALLTQ